MSEREPVSAGPSEGPAAAALLAAGVGAFVLGLSTTLAEVSKWVERGLTFSKPAGPLSGKVVVALAAWVVAWIVLHLALRERGRLNPWVLTTSGVLLLLGLLGTFPFLFHLFEA